MFLHSCNAANYSVLSTLIIIDIICFCYFPPRGIQSRDGLEAFDPITINYDDYDFRIVNPSFLFCQMIVLEVILSQSILLQGLILRNSVGRNCRSNTSMKTNSELKCYTYSCFIRWKREQVSHFCHQPSVL